MSKKKLRTLIFVIFLGFCAILFFFKSSGEDRVAMTASFNPLYPSDNTSLLDLRNFGYDINSDICRPGNDTLFVLFLVHSAPAHFNNRKSIRETFGRMTLSFGYRNRVQTVFLLGKVDEISLQGALEIESRRFGDLVQGNFYDSYRNLTYKHVMGLRWASQFCSHAQFLVKMDDDIFVDVHRLAAALDVRYPYKRNEDRTKNKLACYVQRKMKVVRDVASKWYIPQNVTQRGEHFGDYCSGWAYILTPKTAEKLVHSSLYFPYFWVDDVHVTGTLADHAGIRRDAMNDCCFAIASSDLAQWIRSRGKFSWRYLIGPTWGDVALLKSAHRKAVWCKKVKCKCCFKNENMGDILSENEHTGKSLILAGQAQLVII